jgi:Protein of unknown function (DUF3617)
MPVYRLALSLSVLAGFSLSLPTAATAADDTPSAAAPTEAAVPAPVPPSADAASPAAPAAKPASEAVELPTFRLGLWEYHRTLVRGNAGKPQVSTAKKCLDPGEEMRTKMDNLKKKGCQFAPLRRQGNRYISSWVCQTQTGALRFRDVLVVKDESSYQDVSQTHSGQGLSQQKIEATRLGDCPGMGAGAPLLPTPKRRPPPIPPAPKG